jgi:hypothetical protein
VDYYAIYPNHDLVIVKHSKIVTPTHFYDLYHAILTDQRYRDDYSFVVDGRKLDWKNSNTIDMMKAIQFITDAKKNKSICYCLVQNVGQVAYMDAFFLSTMCFETKFFYRADLLLKEIDITAKQLSL